MKQLATNESQDKQMSVSCTHAAAITKGPQKKGEKPSLGEWEGRTQT